MEPSQRQLGTKPPLKELEKGSVRRAGRGSRTAAALLMLALIAAAALYVWGGELEKRGWPERTPLSASSAR